MSEPVRHFIFECQRWKTQWQKLREVAGTRWGDLSYFLGERAGQSLPSGEYVDGDPNSWKSDLKVVDRTVEFAISKGRLG